jgi:hypothetical protein
MNTRVWVLAVLVALAGCEERLADLDADEDLARPACAPITGWGYFDDGTQQVIFNENTGTAGTACLCMTVDEIVSGSLDDELNDLAFEECTRLVDVYSGGYDWDDCEESYLAGNWPLGVSFAEGDVAWRNIEGLTCGDDDGAQPGCSLGGEQPSPAPAGLCVLIGLVCLYRRQLSRRL